MGLVEFTKSKHAGRTCELAKFAATLPPDVSTELWAQILDVDGIGPYILADAIPLWLTAEHGIKSPVAFRGPLITRHRTRKCLSCAE